MTRRDELIKEYDALIAAHPGSSFVQSIIREGVSVNVDLDLISEARVLIAGYNLNLTRWRGHPDVKRHIERARDELALAFEAAWRQVLDE